MANVAPLPRIPILPPGDCGRLKTVVTVRFQAHRVVSEVCARLYAMKAQQQLVPRRPCAGHLRRSPGILTRSRAKKLLKRARFLGVSHGTALCHVLFEPRAAPGRSDFDAHSPVLPRYGTVPICARGGRASLGRGAMPALHGWRSARPARSLSPQDGPRRPAPRGGQTKTP